MATLTQPKYLAAMVTAALFVVVAVIAPHTGCSVIGVSDPEVRSAGLGVSNTLDTAIALADNPAEFQRSAMVALEQLNRIPPKKVEEFSDLDKQKHDRLLRGIRALIVLAGEPVFDKDVAVVQAYTLGKLARSLGLYEDNKTVGDLTNAVNEHTQTQTAPTGNNAN